MAGIFGGTWFPKSEEVKSIEKILGSRGEIPPRWHTCANGLICVRQHAAGGGGIFIDDIQNRWIAWDGYFWSSADRIHSLEQPEKASSCLLGQVTADLLGAVASLHGSYALVVCDWAAGNIHLIRDPGGSRPLYWAQKENLVMFASTPKVLLVSNIFSTTLNDAAIVSYLSMVAVPDPMTIYKEINMVPAGAVVTWDAKTAKIVLRRHWILPEPTIEDASHCAGEWCDNLRASLELAVDLHGRALGVPGYLLSGGHDTTAVVGLAAKAAQNSQQRPKTLTIGFAGESTEYQRFNEFTFARQAAEFIGTDHNEVVINEQNICDILPKLVWHLDQPSGDAINSYLVSEAASAFFKTIISGSGGDELFIGSHWYLNLFRLNEYEKKWKSIPLPIRKLLLIMPAPELHRRRLLRMDKVCRSEIEKYAHLKFVVKPDEQSLLLSPELFRAREAPLSVVEGYLEDSGNRNALQKMMVLLMRHEVTNMQLRDLDTMSYAHGVEARSPLVDRSVMDCMFSVPECFLAPNGQLRSLMNLALPDILPSITKTRKKMSFIVPMEVWARGVLRDVIYRLLSKESIEKRGLLQWPAIKSLLSDFYVTGREKHPFKIWNVALLELWQRIHIDRPAKDPAVLTLGDLL